MDFIYPLIFDDFLEQSKIPWIMPVDIICRILFSKIFLHLRIFKHHTISIILLIIGFLLLIDIKNDLNDSKANYLYDALFMISKSIAFSIGDAFSKIILTNEFILPQSLMFYKGLFSFPIHCLIIVPILFFTNTIKFDIENLSSGNPLIFFIIIIILVFTSFFKRFITMIIIYIFSPIHADFLNVLFFFFDFILYYLEQTKKEKEEKFSSRHITIFIVSLIIIVFGTLIFCEILIIKICGLSSRTKPGFLKRVELERLERDSSIEQDLIIE